MTYSQHRRHYNSVAQILQEIIETKCACGRLASLAYSGFLCKGSAKDHSGVAFLTPAKNTPLGMQIVDIMSSATM